MDTFLDKITDLGEELFRLVALRNPTGCAYGIVLGGCFYGGAPFVIDDPSPWLCFSLGILIVNVRGFVQAVRGDTIYDEELRRKLAIVDEYRKRGGEPGDVRKLYFEIAKTEIERRGRPLILERPGSEPTGIEAGGDPILPA